MRIIGVAENMSYLVGTGQEIFGSGGGQRLADEIGVPLLGSIPLDPALREAADAGTPVLEAAPDSEATAAIVALADADPADAPRHDPQGAHRPLVGLRNERGRPQAPSPASRSSALRELRVASPACAASARSGRRPPRTSSRRFVPTGKPAGDREAASTLQVFGPPLPVTVIVAGARAERRDLTLDLDATCLALARLASRASRASRTSATSSPCTPGRRRRRATSVLLRHRSCRRRSRCAAANVALRLPSTLAWFPRDVPVRKPTSLPALSVPEKVPVTRLSSSLIRNEPST